MHRTGVSRADLTVVLFVLAPILVAAGCGAQKRTSELADDAERKNRLKYLATAVLDAERFEASLPPAFDAYGTRKQTFSQQPAAIFVHMLPYLDNKVLYDRAKFDDAVVPLYLAAGDTSLPKNPQGITCFVANLRVFSAAGEKTPYNQAIADLSACGPITKGYKTDQIKDGSANTVFFTTKLGDCSGTKNMFSGKPEDAGGPFFAAGMYAGPQKPAAKIARGTKDNLPPYQIDPKSADCNNDPGIYGHSFGSVGLDVVMGDTSARNVSAEVSGETWARALCPNDSQPLGNDW